MGKGEMLPSFAETSWDGKKDSQDQDSSSKSRCLPVCADGFQSMGKSRGANWVLLVPVTGTQVQTLAGQPWEEQQTKEEATSSFFLLLSHSLSPSSHLVESNIEPADSMRKEKCSI